ncbi:MAG: hypothetical protein JWP86_2170 [Phenylobacterium sp.]|nr:hypothetical protein [Phenylobacterium sp.]
MTGLSPTERAAHYRELADMHLQLGQGAVVAEARASHLELAALWTRLAAQAEHEAAQPVRDQDGEVNAPSL